MCAVLGGTATGVPPSIYRAWRANASSVSTTTAIFLGFSYMVDRNAAWEKGLVVR
jgi:hypothetical protein